MDPDSRIERIPDRVHTDDANAEKPHVFIDLRQFSILFQSLPQKHRSILDNPLTQFGTFPAANSQMRMA
jgi:hypothetical protein